MRAAEKLQSVLDGRDRGTDVLELKVQLELIGKAVRAAVPQQMWAEIIAKLEELEQEQHAESLDVGTDAFDDGDNDAYDPHGVHRRGRRVLTSATPAVTERDQRRCLCSRCGCATPARATI